MRRFISKDENAVIVFGLVPDKNLTRLVPIVDQLDARLNAVRKAHPGYGIAVTGLSVIAARNSADMINKLNRALTVEFVFIAAFIGLRVPLGPHRARLSAVGSLPVVAAGSLLESLRLRPAILRHRRAFRLVRLGLKRDHPFPQPHDAGEDAARRTRRSPSSGRQCSWGRRSS